MTAIYFIFAFIGYSLGVYFFWVLAMLFFDKFILRAEKHRDKRKSLREIVLFQPFKIDSIDFLILSFATAILIGLFDGLMRGSQFALFSGYLAGMIFTAVASIFVELAELSGFFNKEERK